MILHQYLIAENADAFFDIFISFYEILLSYMG